MLRSEPLDLRLSSIDEFIPLVRYEFLEHHRHGLDPLVDTRELEELEHPLEVVHAVLRSEKHAEGRT